MSCFSCSSPDKILNSPLNNSKAKFHYSFSKSPRFNKIKTYCVQAHYDFKSQLANQAAKVGTGPRSDFTKPTSIAPAPTQYMIASKFEKSNRGQTFGLSRNQMKEFGHITQGIQKHPGVGQYNSENKNTSLKFTMRPKTPSRWLPLFLRENKIYEKTVPGPGSYDSTDVDISRLGRSVIAKYQSVPASSISKSARFKDSRFKTPGPCQYTYPDYLNDSGQYRASWNRGNGKRIMSKEQRKSFIDRVQNTTYGPGPGQYRQPSEFGHYDYLEISNSSFYKQSRPRTASVGRKR